MPEIDSGKLDRIMNADIGTLVAFRTESGKVKSAKIVNRSSKNRKLKLETAYGKQFVVDYEDVIWVRTNSRWPKGVFEMLKGSKDGSRK